MNSKWEWRNSIAAHECESCGDLITDMRGYCLPSVESGLPWALYRHKECHEGLIPLEECDSCFGLFERSELAEGSINSYVGFYCSGCLSEPNRVCDRIPDEREIDRRIDEQLEREAELEDDIGF